MGRANESVRKAKARADHEKRMRVLHEEIQRLRYSEAAVQEQLPQISREKAYFKRRWIEAIKGLEVLRRALADYIRIVETPRESWSYDEVSRLAECRELAALAPSIAEALIKAAEMEAARVPTSGVPASPPASTPTPRGTRHSRT